MITQQAVFTKNNGWNFVTAKQELKTPLVFIFGNRYLLETEEIFKEVKKQFPTGNLVFGSSAGEVLHDKVNLDSVSVTAVAFERTTYVIKTHNILEEKGNSKKAGFEAVSKLPKDGLRHIFVISEGTHVNGSELTKGMQEAAGDSVLITGGLCGDDGRFEKTLASYNELPKEGEIVVIGFYGDSFESTCSIYGGWTPFGPKRRVTKSEGNVLFKLDDKPALDLYKKYLGDKASELPQAALIFPLNVTPEDGGQAYVRTILNIDDNNNSMILAGDIPEGATVQLMMTNMDNIAAASETAAQLAISGRKNKPTLALLVSCIGRKLVLDQRVEEESEEVLKVVGEGVTIGGFYSYGEIAPFNNEQACKLHNQTMTITLISE